MNEASPDKKSLILTSMTLVPVSLAFAVGLGLFTSLRWIDTRFTEMSAQIIHLQIKIDHLEEQLSSVIGSRWTLQDQEIFVLRFKNLNPALAVPETKDIHR